MARASGCWDLEICQSFEVSSAEKPVAAQAWRLHVVAYDYLYKYPEAGDGEIIY